jgi:hypothetical protein
LVNEDNKKYWLLGFIAVAFSSFIKIYGVLNCAFFLLPFITYRKNFYKLAIFVLASSFFVFYWYLRNEILFGYFTLSHGIFEQFISSNIFRPFSFTLFLLGNNKPANLWVILFLIICLGPLFLYSKKRIQSTAAFKQWLVLIIGTTIGFTVIYFLSLVSRFDFLEGRLLAPVYIQCFLILFVSSQILFDYYKTNFKYFFVVLPVIFFVLNPAFDKAVDWKINVNYPAEHVLWNELNQKEFIKNSSHYITDFNYIHQIYGGLPQRIITFDFMFLNIGFLHKITNTGNTPFVVLRNNELPYFYFEKLYKALNYKKADLQNNHFTVYIKNENQ